MVEFVVKALQRYAGGYAALLGDSRDALPHDVPFLRDEQHLVLPVGLQYNWCPVV